MAQVDYSINRLKVVKEQDPLVRLLNDKVFVARSGVRDNRYDQAITQNLSNQSATVNLRLPSDEIVFSRQLYARATYTVTFTALAAGGNIIQNELSAPAAFPISRTSDQLTVQIDSTSFNSSPNRYWPALSRYFAAQSASSDSFLDFSTTPSMIDQYQTYNDFVAFGSGRNPLAAYGENSAQQTRGGFPQTISLNNTTNAVVTFQAVEPLFISPLVWGEMASKKASGGSGATNLQFTWTFADLSKVWSHNIVAKPLTSIAVNIDAFDVLVRYGSFKFSQYEERIARELCWDYENIFVYQQNTPTVNAGANTSQTSGSIQLKSIPNRIYIYLQRTLANINHTIPDCFARINSIDIQWNARSGILSTATAQDLYHLSVKNGLKSCWAQWQIHSGSVLCIDLASDMGLDSLEVPGVNQDNQLRVNVNFTNIFATNEVFVLYVTAITPGLFEYNMGNFYQQLGVLSTQDVLDAPIDYDMMDYSYNMEGGGFSGGRSILSKFKNIYEKAKKYIKPIQKGIRIGADIGQAIGSIVAPEFAPEIAKAANIARKIGSAKLPGKGMSGGKALSEKQKMNKALRLLMK